MVGIRRVGVPLVALVAVVVAVLGGVVLGGVVAPTNAQDTALRPLAETAGLDFGSAVDVDALAVDAAYRQLLVDNVTMVSTIDELDVGVVAPMPGVYDFSRADAVVDFAAENGMTVRGHGIIGGDALPEWLSGGTWTAESLTQVLRDHVTAVVSHYAQRNPGVVTEWDVVDEVFLPDGTPRDTLWRQVIGDDYLRIAFEAARAADPDALLFYDDFYDDLSVTQDAVDSGVAIVPGATAERSTCDEIPKCVGVRSAITALIAAGGPIDGVGVQARMLSPDPLDLGEFARWVEDLGLRWTVTEFDVPVPITEVADPDTLAFQADVYAGALAACVEAAGCNTFVTWGITDRVSSAPADTSGAFGGALWFDETDAPKPAFDAMAAVLAPPIDDTTTIDDTSTVAETTPDVTDEPTATPVGENTPAVIATERSETATAVMVGGGALLLVALVVVVARRRSATDETSP